VAMCATENREKRSAFLCVNARLPGIRDFLSLLCVYIRAKDKLSSASVLALSPIVIINTCAAGQKIYIIMPVV
jgi:hypothetical protein